MAPSVESLDKAVLRWPTPKSRRWIKCFVEDAARDQNIAAVVVVGSATRHGVSSEDLDVVVMCERREMFRYKAPIEVDVRTFDLAEADAHIANGHDLLGWAIKFGRVVFDRDGGWRHLVLRWHRMLPLPDPSLARERAAVALGHLHNVERIGDQSAASELRVSYLTLIARATLVEASVYPISRPELAGQLRSVGEVALAAELDAAIAAKRTLPLERPPPS